MNGLKLRIGAVDRRILHALALRRGRWLTPGMRGLTRLGDAPAISVVAALLLVGGVPGVEPLGSHGALALVLSRLLWQLVKCTVSRLRPTLPVGLGCLIKPPDHFSFPSGYASATLYRSCSPSSSASPSKPGCRSSLSPSSSVSPAAA